jgi:hypothetical protein
VHIQGSTRRATAAGAVLALLLGVHVPHAQEQILGRDRSPADPAVGYDQLLDEDVRDGLVYYRALKSTRGRLDAYVSSLASVRLDAASREEQIAFWLNAYNAFVLQTVVDHYPITPLSKDYPAQSIQQIPGAFAGLRHKVANQSVTLDEIETRLAGFKDARIFLALGRGAMGSGRLRSEAYTSESVSRQLAEAQAECVTRAQCFQVDQASNRVRVSSIFYWRQHEFSELYAAESPPMFSKRSAPERAVLAFVIPQLYDEEREFIGKNTFRVEYLPFDWALNDLTGR